MSETRLEIQLAALLFSLFLALNFVSAQSPADAGTLKILSHNLHAEEDALEPMAAMLRAADADIVALQEVSEAAFAYFTAELDYPHAAMDDREGRYNGMALLSRYEILSYTVADDMRLLRAHVDVNGTTMAIYNAHPVSPGNTGMDRDPRSAEIAWLLEQIGFESTPVLLLGDFNMEEWSPDYDAIRATFVDPFRALYPDNPGFTYPDYSLPQAQVNARLPVWTPPVLRLDYIFHSAGFAYVDAGVVDQASGSDHRAVWALLTLD